MVNEREAAPASRTPSPDNGEVSSKLEALRGRIDAIDRRLIDLLGERQKEVGAVVALKREHNLPVYHPAREEDLISTRRAQAAEVGFDPEYVEQIFRTILRSSRVSQTARIARKGVRPGATVLIVGGKGSLGQYLARWFTGAGYQVRILDRNDWARVGARCAGIDLALVSVPIDVTEEVVTRLGGHLPADCVLADVTSLKERPLAAMLASHPGPVVGLHPLFGPTTASMDKQLVVVTPGRMVEACQWVVDQFAAWGSVIVQADPAEHDESMAIVQALRHFASFAFGRFLYRRRVDLHRTLDFSSPIYRLELGMVGRLFAQDPSLYASIIFALPERRDLLAEYVESLGETTALLESDDTAAFCREFTKIAEWFGPFSDQAIRESSYLIEKLIERF
jgi:chorismate mutase/prephenate dehydrogenase